MVNADDVAGSMAPEGIHTFEADKIMQDADTLAEQKIKSRFPELHTAQPVPT